MKLIFDKEDILDILTNYPTNEEYKVAIENPETEILTEAQQKLIIVKAIHTVESWTYDDIIKESNKLGVKKNGKFRKGAVTSLLDINIADYVTDFTSCWYHDRIALRAIDEDTLEVSFERTQHTF